MLILGLIAIAAGVGIHEYFMRTQRLHIEGMTERGIFIGSALILVGIIYAITPGTLAKVLMVLLMVLANVGLIAALYILSTVSPDYPPYWNYLYYIKWVFLPAWLIVNIGGAIYFVETRKGIRA